MNKTIQYLFILALVLIVVAYYVGTTNILGSAGNILTNVGNTYTGRTSQGNFAGYAK